MDCDIKQEMIHPIAINHLTVNATSEDSKVLKRVVDYLQKTILSVLFIKTIYREVEELKFSSTKEIYIISEVIRTKKELVDWVKEYEELNKSRPLCIIFPVMIINGELLKSEENIVLINKAKVSVYIKKVSYPFACFRPNYHLLKAYKSCFKKILVKVEQSRIIDASSILQVESRNPSAGLIALGQYLDLNKLISVNRESLQDEEEDLKV